MKTAVNSAILSLLVTVTGTLAYFVYELNAKVYELEGRMQAAVLMSSMVQENVKTYVGDSLHLMKQYVNSRMEMCK